MAILLRDSIFDYRSYRLLQDMRQVTTHPEELK
jgi:hypothetical protein